MEGLELRKALEEAQRLVGARLAKVFQREEVFFLRFYDPPGMLAIDLKAKAVHLSALRPPFPPTPPPWAQLLRTLTGQKLLQLAQAGWDRLIRLSFPSADVVVDFRPRAGDLFLIEREGRALSYRGGTYEATEFGEGDPRQGLGPELRKAAQAQLGHKPTEEELMNLAWAWASLPPKGFLYATPQGLKASFFDRTELGSPKAVFPTFWEALDQVLQARLEQALAEEYRRRIERAVERRERALAALAVAEQEAQRWPELKEQADLIMTRLRDIPPRAAEVEVEGFDGRPVKIRLNPLQTPVAYAQALYRKASKWRRRLEHLPQRRTQLEREIAELKRLLHDLHKRPDLAPYLVAEELQDEEPTATQPPVKITAAREWVIDGFRILVGRSAQENDALLRRAHRDDLWLHARDVPGAHVLIRTEGKPVPEEVLRKAGELAAWFSRARGEPKVLVSYTEVRYVKKPRGAPPGAVTLLRENVMVVSGKEAP